MVKGLAIYMASGYKNNNQHLETAFAVSRIQSNYLSLLRSLTSLITSSATLRGQGV